MKNTVIASIVAVLCTAAICVTYAVKSPANVKETSAVSADTTYMTEAEAAEYIGVRALRALMFRIITQMPRARKLTTSFTIRLLLTRLLRKS